MITATARDNADNIWLGSKGDGIAVFLNTSQRFTLLGKGLGEVQEISVDNEGKVWVSHSNGIHVYRNRRLVDRYSLEVFDSKLVNAIAFNDETTIFGTDEGLFRLDDDAIHGIWK